ncbi:uncharacterized protein LOC113470313 isoform X3 [Diaphorina citri]|uniref:Uncharacterized protein LOC113470313 isoform X3 n=1 Tax=Diaphorina citri TaxID=121845 RepID=A0A3Q0JBZ9_DIACI|nr:uncharacterized protein LOC113470313 isoform X3 [Diaphorina citri]
MFKTNVHNRTDMTKAVKMQYLMSKLTDRALSVTAGVPPTEDNYDIIFDALVEKYNDKRVIASHYLDTLFSYKPIRTESSVQLGNFVDKFGATVAALRALDIDIGEFILFYLANSKLDEETRRAFETSLVEEMPTFKKLLEFLSSRTKMLSRVNPGPSNSSHSKGDSFSNSYKRPGPHTFLVKKDLGSSSSCPSYYGNSQITCILCNKNHFIAKCEQFLHLSPKDRYVIVKQHALCVNCLCPNHRAYECVKKIQCGVCKLKHNSLLHFQSKQVESKQVELNHASNDSGNSQVCACTPELTGNAAGTTVLLSTVKVLVKNSNLELHPMRFILDSGSMVNILTKDAANFLNLSLKPNSSHIKGINSNSSKVYGQVKFDFSSRFDTRINYTVQALVVDSIVEKLPTQPVDYLKLHHLKNIRLADDEFMYPCKIDGILGAQVYPHLLENSSIVSEENQPIALATKLGYVIMGNAPILNMVNMVDTHHSNNNDLLESDSLCMFQRASLDQMNSQLCKFWELENIISKKDVKLSPEEKECEKIYIDGVSRDSQGIYSVPLPFKEDPKKLGDSFHIACKRFLNLERKLETSNELKQNYNSAVKELIDRKFMVLSEDQSKTNGYFIPCHLVVRLDKASSKFRVVYDASCKTNTGLSLNDLLHTGPKLYTDLLGVLLNFRLFEHALNGDIAKMFLNIKLLPDYWKYQIILWRFSTDDKLMVYELRVVIFGTSASPYLAQRTVHKLVEDEQSRFPLAGKLISQSLYMDDCVISFLKKEDAIKFYQEVVAMFSSGGFKFTKWSSNCKEILSQIPVEDRLSELISWSENNFSHKILGMSWNTTQDCLFFDIDKIEGPCTKRGILSSILSVFDPMGLIAPVVLFVKLLIKEMWQIKLGWDDTPPQSIVNLWNVFLQEMHLLKGLTFPRHISVFENCTFELIGFSDASQKGYGAVVYSRVTCSDGSVLTSLICSRSRVSPAKTESIPRLELCALVLLSDVIDFVVNTYNSRYKIENVFCFTDSSVALCWVSSSPHLWNVFVANRVSRVQQKVNVEKIFHINGEGFSGPPWLKTNFENWPIKNYSSFKSETVPEKKANVVLIGTNGPSENYLLDCFNKMVSWNSILKVMVFILRFTKKLKPPSSVNFVSAEDLNLAELFVMKIIQSHHFAEDLDKIKKGSMCSSAMKKLCPFLDKDDVLRVGGRLGNSQQDYDYQHPILLPSKCKVVELLIDYVHRKNFHTGPHLLLSLLRQKYWILNGRNLTKKVFHKCNLCFIHNPKFVYPKMGELPSSRVLGVKPFLNTACDYLGPINITLSGKRGQRSQKAYICLFICLATKALHLEVVSDLSTAVFINALKRFLARRGPVKTILSDNGTNFVGAKNQLNEIYKLLESENYKEQFSYELAEYRIQWIFNPPSAPHFGGLFESNVKSFKTHLLKVIGSQLLSYEELSTLTCLLENLLNSRPLCQIHSDPTDGEMLTPNHFLKLTSLQCIPALDVVDCKSGRLTRFQLIDQIYQHFWKKWSNEYLSTLQVREKWFSDSRPILPGTVVLIKQENTAPCNWLKGVITEVFPGKDSIPRVAMVKTIKGSYKRPICKLAPLPTQ